MCSSVSQRRTVSPAVSAQSPVTTLLFSNLTTSKPMETTNTETIKPWVFAHWSKTDLAYVAGALQTMNPLGFRDAESRASYIRDLAERELNHRLEAGKTDAFDISTGGFTVCFIKWDDGQWHAIATVSPYVCAVFIAKMNIPNQECFINKEPNGSGGFYKGVRVKSMLRSWD